MIGSTLQYIRDCIKQLNEVDPKYWAEKYVDLRMDFARKRHGGLIFSTRFGASFFEEVERYLLNNSFVEPDEGFQIGDYDKNFNIWLKQTRTEKI